MGEKKNFFFIVKFVSTSWATCVQTSNVTQLNKKKYITSKELNLHTILVVFTVGRILFTILSIAFTEIIAIYKANSVIHNYAYQQTPPKPGATVHRLSSLITLVGHPFPSQDYMALVKDILNHEGHQNCLTGS